MILSNHPKSLWVLSFSNLWETFSYYGTQTILVLYFIQIFHLSRSDSYLLYGAYAAFTFSLPVFGGIIADKWVGSTKALVIGNLLNITGNLLLMSLNRAVFCVGLAMVLIGIGLYKSSAAHLVGMAYQNKTQQKEAGFTWLYLAINLGGTLGPLFYGFIAYSFAWNYVFLCSATGISISLLWLAYNWKFLNVQSEEPFQFSKFKIMLLSASLILVCVSLSLLFYFPQIITLVIFILFLVGIFYLIIAIMKYKDRTQQRLWALLLLSFFSMFYFAAGLQVGTSIVLFIQENISRGIIHTQLPASTFGMLYPLFVLILAPFFTHLWQYLKNKNRDPRTPFKLVIGISVAMFGIVAFAISAENYFIIPSIIIGYMLLSAGELIITPSMYTALSDLAPEGIKSTMMGAWFLFIGLGGYLSSLLANAAHFTVSKLIQSNSSYSGEFMLIAIFLLIVVIASALSIPKLLKMMA